MALPMPRDEPVTIAVRVMLVVEIREEYSEWKGLSLARELDGERRELWLSLIERNETRVSTGEPKRYEEEQLDHQDTRKGGCANVPSQGRGLT